MTSIFVPLEFGILSPFSERKKEIENHSLVKKFSRFLCGELEAGEATDKELAWFYDNLCLLVANPDMLKIQGLIQKRKPLLGDILQQLQSHSVGLPYRKNKNGEIIVRRPEYSHYFMEENDFIHWSLVAYWIGWHEIYEDRSYTESSVYNPYFRGEYLKGRCLWRLLRVCESLKNFNGKLNKDGFTLWKNCIFEMREYCRTRIYTSTRLKSKSASQKDQATILDTLEQIEEFSLRKKEDNQVLRSLIASLKSKDLPTVSALFQQCAKISRNQKPNIENDFTSFSSTLWKPFLEAFKEYLRYLKQDSKNRYPFFVNKNDVLAMRDNNADLLCNLSTKYIPHGKKVGRKPDAYKNLPRIIEKEPVRLRPYLGLGLH